MSTVATARLRVVVAKVGLDGHDRGVKVVARAFRDAGMEVVYTGLRRSPQELAEIVLQEDADALGLSILSGAVVPLTRRVVDALHTAGLDDVLVIVGGIIGEREAAQLRELGVKGAFGPGTSLTEIVDFMRANVRRRQA